MLANRLAEHAPEGGNGALPVPFLPGRTDELAGSVIHDRTLPSGIELYTVDFSDGKSQDIAADKVYLVHVPAGVGPVPVERVILDSNGGARAYYGYLYTSADAAKERAAQTAARFTERFPGVFFASAGALTAHGEDLRSFARVNEIDFRLAGANPTVSGGVVLGGQALLALVPVDSNLRFSIAPVCGNAWVTANEVCDDGNAVGGDGCSTACQVEHGYRCEGTSPSTCSRTAVCGDGSLETGEACDDGNAQAGDGCSQVCLVEEGFTCNQSNPSICAMTATCGNGRVEAAERCDDGNREPQDGCSPECTVDAMFACDGGEPSRCVPVGVCGDGHRDDTERCDDGGTQNGDGCDSACDPEPGFVCDDSSPSDCSRAPVCGDGSREGAEACDDGNAQAGDGCDPSCVVEPGFACTKSIEETPLTTLISVPGGGWWRVGPQLSQRAGEQPAPVLPLDDGRVRLAHGADYDITREVEQGRDSLRIRDTFTNAGPSDLGFMVEYRLPLPDDVATVHVGGDPDPRRSTAGSPSPRNPTLYAKLNERFAVGLAVQDDALRNQGLFQYRSKGDGGDGALGVRTERLVVPAGKSVTLEIALYVLPGGDYWDFVNRVRADWGVSVTLDGPYWWIYPSTLPLVPREWFRQKTAGWLSSHRIKAAVGPSWLLPEFEGQRWFAPSALGPAIWDEYFAPFRAQLRDAFTAIREVASSLPEGSPGRDIELLVYNHAFFRSPLQPDDFASPSAVTVADGTLYRENWGKAYATGAALVPRLTDGTFDAYSQQTIDAFRRQFTDPEMAVPGMGIYLDESDGPGRLVDKITYKTWDGFSGILDPVTFAVQQRIGYIAVLSREFRSHVLEEFGVPTLANDQPYLLDENQGQALRFTEMWGNPSNAYFAHLYSPLAFVHGIEAVSMQDVRDLLEMGMVLCITAPEAPTALAVERFFPITVTELHSGWIQGRERIITAVPGDYGWEGEYEARLWRFGADGRPLETEPPWFSSDGKQWIEVPDGGVVVLERRYTP